MKEYDIVVFIGRFQPFHSAHSEILKKALEYGKKVYILVGSAYKARDIKNPWTWEERANIILSSYIKNNNIISNIKIVPLRDNLYNDQKWAEDVQKIVLSDAKDNDKIAIIGHLKDDSSYYLKMFPQWDLINLENIDGINATDIRNAYFSNTENFFNSEIAKYVNETTLHFLKVFELTDAYENLKKEYEFIKAYKKAWEKAPYDPTFITVDAVVVQSGHVLLVKRRAHPGNGLYALPGGFIKPNEYLVDAMLRELKEETKIKVPKTFLKNNIKFSKVYDAPSRSLRGRTITHAYMIELPHGELPKVKGSDDAEKARWIPLSVFENMEEHLFEDHYHIVIDMVNSL